MNSKNLSRRTILKGIAGATAATGLTGFVSAHESTEQEENPLEETPYDFEYITVDKEVKEVVGGHWPLLVVDRDRLDELLEKAPTDGAATNKDRLTEIRDNFPVELTESENEKTYNFEPQKSSLPEVNEQKRKKLIDISKAVGKGYDKESENTIGTFSKEFIHGQMGAAAFKQENFNYRAPQLAEDAAGAPDNWDRKCRDCDKNWVRSDFGWPREKLEDVVLDIIQSISGAASPHHMYIPEGSGHREFKIPAGDANVPVPITLIGAADNEIQALWDKDIDGWGWSRIRNKIENCSYMLHFVQDAANPLHTGNIGTQVYNKEIHFDYEDDIVGSNWEAASDGSEALESVFEKGCEDGGSFHWPGSATEIVKDAATDSNHLSDMVVKAMMENDYEKAYDVARACVYYSGMYSTTLINEYM